MFVEIYYSQVPNKQISIMREYHDYFPNMVNEYHVINEYIGKTHDIHKWIWPNKRISRYVAQSTYCAANLY